MIEPEIAFADLDDDAALAEDYLKYCIQFCLDNVLSDIEFLNEKAQARQDALAKALVAVQVQGGGKRCASVTSSPRSAGPGSASAVG